MNKEKYIYRCIYFLGVNFRCKFKPGLWVTDLTLPFVLIRPLVVEESDTLM